MKTKREPVDRETFIKNVKKVRLPFVKKIKPGTLADQLISLTPDEVEKYMNEHMDSIAGCRCSLVIRGEDKEEEQ